LEVETGLGRGGFRAGELATAMEIVAASHGLRLAGLWTHLQAPEDHERTRAQLERFDAAGALLRRARHRLPPRHVAASGGLLVRGRRAPLVGNVAMDAVMADVTDVPGAPVTVADEVVLLGRQEGDEITAAELAAARATNSWEVVTSMAARLPRVYHAPSGALG